MRDLHIVDQNRKRELTRIDQDEARNATEDHEEVQEAGEQKPRTGAQRR